MALEPTVYLTTTDVAFFVLLTITPPAGSITPVIRVVNNNEDVVSRGDTYMAFPFEFKLPVDDGERQPAIQVMAANSSQDFIEAVRSMLEPPTVKLELISSLDPDMPEKVIDFLRLDSVTYDAMSITFSLQPINILARNFPNTTYNAVEFPDLLYR